MYDVCNRKSDTAAPCFHSPRSLLFLAQYLLWNKSWVFPRLLKASCVHSPKFFKLSKCPGSFVCILKYPSNPHAHAFLKQSLAIDQVFPTLPRPQTASKKLERTKEVSTYLPDSREAMNWKDVHFIVMMSPLALEAWCWVNATMLFFWLFAEHPIFCKRSWRRPPFIGNRTALLQSMSSSAIKKSLQKKEKQKVKEKEEEGRGRKRKKRKEKVVAG